MLAQSGLVDSRSWARGRDVLTPSTREHLGQTCDVLVSCGVRSSEPGLGIIKILPRIPNFMLKRLNKSGDQLIFLLAKQRKRDRNNLFC